MIHPWTAAVGPAAEALARRIAALVPQLTTARLILRAPALADMPAFATIYGSDRAVHIDGPYGAADAWFDFAAATALWLLRGHGMWTVTDRAGHVLGFVAIGFEPGDHEHELGFVFLDQAEGHGYASEAALAARDFAFQVLHLPSLVSYVAPENTRSRALAQRLGAVLDGHLDGSEVWRHHPAGAA